MSRHGATGGAGSGDGDGDGAERVFVVLATGPDEETLRELARTLVRERLCACVNVVPGLSSVYRWKGEVETAPEALALLKTTRARLGALEGRYRELHPYDEPEFLALDVDLGSASYLEWVADSVERPS